MLESLPISCVSSLHLWRTDGRRIDIELYDEASAGRARGGTGLKSCTVSRRCWKRALIKGVSQSGVQEASGGEALLWRGLWGSWKLLNKPVKAGIYSAALGVDSSHMLVPSLLWKLIALIVPVFTLACEQTAQFVSSGPRRALSPRSRRQLMRFYFHGCDLILDPNKQKSHLVLTAFIILWLLLCFNTFVFSLPQTVKQEKTWCVRADGAELLQGLLAWLTAQWEAMFGVKLQTRLHD